MVIVAAAGNRVGGNVQVGAPATIPGVLTVAGLDGDGRASVDSSSRGSALALQHRQKTSLAAFPAADTRNGLELPGPRPSFPAWPHSSGPSGLT